MPLPRLWSLTAVAGLLLGLLYTETSLVWAVTPVLVETVDGSSDPPTNAGKITFHNVSFTDGTKAFSTNLNPIITGKNVYAVDFLRVDVGGVPAWRVYRGAWQNSGDVNDRIYRQTSDDLDPAGPWTAPQIAVDFGDYIHVNDPAVVLHNGVYTMTYTTLKDVSGSGDSNGVRDWINYSTSTDGINWSPSAGSTSTEINMSDPEDIALGSVGEIARPALARTDTGWRMWFDALTDEGLPTERRDSYLAIASDLAPTDFEIIHRYPAIGNFPGFFEPDVQRRPDGTYLAVVQRNFGEIWQATSTDGVNFSFYSQPIVDVDEPAFTRESVSNPGLLYDQIDDLNYGVGFGMTDSPALVDHDIGFAYSQYIINVRSPDGTWHVLAESELMVDQKLSVSQFSEFDLVRIINPVSGAILLERDFTDADPGDTWELRFLEPLSADFDADNDVDGNDFLRWQRGLGMTSGASKGDGDADGDGDVDKFDLGVLQDNFGYQLGNANLPGRAIPEPATCAPMLLGLATLFHLSRRRGISKNSGYRKCE